MTPGSSHASTSGRSDPDLAGRLFAIVGGTGAVGQGLAHRLLRAGFPVVIGSRDSAKGEAAAGALAAAVAGASVTAVSNEEAARRGEVVIVTVPFGSQRDVLGSVRAAVQGKIVIDTSVCLNPPKVSLVQIPPEGSACMQSQALLGPGARVVAAFQNVSAKHLLHEGDAGCDILICGDDEEARHTVLALVGQLGFKGWIAGPLANSVAVEGMTSVLIAMNRRHKLDGAGIRITGEA